MAVMAKGKKLIIVASKNPVKVNAVKLGFEKVFSEMEFEIEGISAKSEVADQPMSEKETIQGATNRVNNAVTLKPEADYWVGIEGGLEVVENEMEVFAWIIVKSHDGKVGRGRTASFFLPENITKLIRDGLELGDAVDKVFQRTNEKQHSGAVGILTHDLITRTDYYVPAVILALIPFRNPELY